MVDNVFATPLFQRPMPLGADIVVYSATKHIDGQGRCLGGVVLGTKDFIEDKSTRFSSTPARRSARSMPGYAERPRDAAPTGRAPGVSAAAMAEGLDARTALVRVFYPGRSDHPQAALAKRQMAGGGPMVAFEIKGDKKEAFRFMNALQIFKISNNLGDAKSLVTHPATTTHQRLTPEARAELGIFDNSLRLSIGLEDVRDLVADLDHALTLSRG